MLFDLKSPCVILFLLHFLPVNSRKLDFEHGTCGEDKNVQVVRYFSVRPSPPEPVINRITRINVTADLEILEDLTEAIVWEFKVFRIQTDPLVVVGPKEVELPLWTIKNNTCDMLNNQEFYDNSCRLLTAMGVKCSCPIPKGRYRVNNVQFEADISKIRSPSILINYGSGNYKVRAKVFKRIKKIDINSLTTSTPCKEDFFDPKESKKEAKKTKKRAKQIQDYNECKKLIQEQDVQLKKKDVDKKQQKDHIKKVKDCKKKLKKLDEEVDEEVGCSYIKSHIKFDVN